MKLKIDFRIIQTSGRSPGRWKHCKFSQAKMVKFFQKFTYLRKAELFAKIKKIINSPSGTSLAMDLVVD